MMHNVNSEEETKFKTSVLALLLFYKCTYGHPTPLTVKDRGKC